MSTKSIQSQALLERALNFQKAGQLDMAIEHYRKILETEKTNPDALHLCGVALGGKDQFEEAETMLRDALTVHPDKQYVHNNLGSLLRKTGRQLDAKNHFKKAIEISPGYFDGLLNFGNICLDLDEVETAWPALLKAHNLLPNDPRPFNGLGTVKRKEGKFAEAIEYYDKAIELFPNYALAYYNKGMTQRQSGDLEGGILSLQKSLEISPNVPNSLNMLGTIYNQLDEVDKSIAAFELAIEIAPEDMNSHLELNQVLWTSDRTENHLQSFVRARAKKPQSVLLCCGHGASLTTGDRHEEAEEAYRSGLKIDGNSVMALDGLAQSLRKQKRFEEALPYHRKIEDLGIKKPLAQMGFARTLMHLGDFAAALEKLEECDEVASEVAQIDQEQFALVALCYKNLGDPRAEYYLNFEDFVVPFEIETPTGFGSVEEFNAALLERLKALHTAKNHPMEQTLRNGSQTYGRLFDLDDPLIEKVRLAQEECIARYLAGLPKDDAHPFLRRNKGTFRFTDNFSVRLKKGGYHTNHIHSHGWISSAYYVEVPEEVSTTSDKAGWINFGRPNELPGCDDEPDKWIQPKPGVLALFPSYIYHGTEPFVSDSYRTTVVFDALPGKN